MAQGSLATQIAARVDQDRLWRRLMELARIGATGKGGVHRLALTGDEIAARHLLIAWARNLGLSVFTDDISNLFFRLEGTDANAAPQQSFRQIGPERMAQMMRRGAITGLGLSARPAAAHILAGIIATPDADPRIVEYSNEALLLHGRLSREGPESVLRDQFGPGR